ncbi:MAG: UDP-N-acetylmuramate--L-alanine ligase [Actinobacteria bacterium]|uniref:UDP-N-acetylmuramate--L-alanine ligase n=1 Tax=freshwater metagenome TaxID=449393 RepID=A0A6J7C5G3_9ZZZZ|nr:UDP-N-acetylmuramate--L-alanine ligase [Actinomycetota bacterium]
MSTAPNPPIDLTEPRRLHVVGVGGPGMSAIAIVLAEMGHDVSGSDIRERSVLDRVRAAGVDVHVGHSRELVHDRDAITWSTAIPARNVERDEADKVGVLSMHRSGMLAAICARAKSLAVAGTHGKTSTTSMLMLMLSEAGVRPSFVIGGDVTDMGTGAQWTGAEWLVVEADESDGTHLQLPLYGTILTNVEVDHLDHYGTFEAIVEGFDQYFDQVDGPKVLCIDDPTTAALAARHSCITYGTSPEADFRAVDVMAGEGSFTFSVLYRGERLGSVSLPLRGVHNVRNATGALAMAVTIGVSFEIAAAALAKFGGVARRFDVRGVDGGATLVDDYAHLPSEIGAVLAAARQSGDGWNRVVAVFQPNRFNRIVSMWPDYHSAFVDADVVVLTEIYASGTAPIPGITGKLLVNAVLDAHPRARVVWMPKRAELVEFLAGELREGDVCISMGCGDIASLPDEVQTRRSERRLRAT